MFEVAEDRNDEDLLVIAHSAAQVSHFSAGALVASNRHAQQVIAKFNADRYRRLAAMTHHHPRTTAGVFLGQATWMLGYPDRALSIWSEALHFAGHFNHPLNSCLAWAAGGLVAAYRRDAVATADATAAAYRIGREIGSWFMNHVVTPATEAFAAHERGDFERVCNSFHWINIASQARGGRSNLPNWCCIWARSKAMLGDMQGAQEIVAMGLEQIRTPGWGERTHLAELLRVEGELHLMRDDVDRAIVSFEESLAWAREQQAKSWELRTAMSYARLMQSQGRRAEAVDLLRPIYDWFTEGRDTRDHIEARALLEDLERPQAVP
jgi:hypothetical protein